jgi:hypothetical protein
MKIDPFTFDMSKFCDIGDTVLYKMSITNVTKSNRIDKRLMWEISHVYYVGVVVTVPIDGRGYYSITRLHTYELMTNSHDGERLWWIDEENHYPFLTTDVLQKNVDQVVEILIQRRKQ